MAGRSFDLEQEITKISGRMMSFDEFYALLKRCLYESLSGFPQAEIDAYLKSDAFELKEIRKRYDEGVQRYNERVKSNCRPFNMAFFGSISQLDSLLTLCFE